MVPLYIKYMGAEAYGLVGFFAMLQACFILLDMGLTPTMARESARYRGGATTALQYRRLARALEGVFLAVGLLGGGILFALAQPLATGWLNTSQIAQDEVVVSLQLIAVIVALRWMCGLYRGVITGAERLIWLSGFNIVIGTGRFLLVLPFLVFISAAPSTFFLFQLAVAMFEFLGLAWMAYRILPSVNIGEKVRWEWRALQPVLKFSLSIAATSSVWVLVTQMDKLVLSAVLPLGDYGYFTVAVLVASGIMILSAPISSAITPRLTKLQAEGDNTRLIKIYRQATQLVVVVTVPVTLVLALFAPQVLWAWTGQATLVGSAAPVLSLYSVGYGLLVLGAFPYYLQYAKGDLKLHLAGSAFFLLLLVPSIIWAASRYGMTGAGWAWLIANAAYFLFWTPIVHRRLCPGMHGNWLLNDIVRPAASAVIVGVLVAHWMPWSESRGLLVIELFITGGVLMLLCYASARRVTLSRAGARFGL